MFIVELENSGVPWLSTAAPLQQGTQTQKAVKAGRQAPRCAHVSAVSASHTAKTPSQSWGEGIFPAHRLQSQVWPAEGPTTQRRQMAAVRPALEDPVRLFNTDSSTTQTQGPKSSNGPVPCMSGSLQFSGTPKEAVVTHLIPPPTRFFSFFPILSRLFTVF